MSSFTHKNLSLYFDREIKPTPHQVSGGTISQNSTDIWYNKRMNETAKEKKHDLRCEMRARRREVSPEERAQVSAGICRKLMDDPAVRSTLSGSGALAVYLASCDEIDLSGLVNEMIARGARVVSPRWNGETYDLARIKSLSADDLRLGPMNILEPDEADITRHDDVAVWIVPGLAFTADGRRLGYGGGWYDRLLADAAPDSVKIGVAHSFQLVPGIPVEAHDAMLDRIVTA